MLTQSGFTRIGLPPSVTGLHPSNVGLEVPVGENLEKVPTFLNLFVKAKGNYLATDIRTPA